MCCDLRRRVFSIEKVLLRHSIRHRPRHGIFYDEKIKSSEPDSSESVLYFANWVQGKSQGFDRKGVVKFVKRYLIDFQQCGQSCRLHCTSLLSACSISGIMCIFRESDAKEKKQRGVQTTQDNLYSPHRTRRESRLTSMQRIFCLYRQ